MSGGVATTISEQVERIHGTLVAMCSHGRAGILEAVLGSVALKLLRLGHGPMIVYRPRGGGFVRGGPAETIESLVLALDGKPLSEAMAPRAAEMARWLSARLVVITVVGSRAKSPAGVPAGDTMESSYVRAFASELGRRYGLQVGWEVLHGDPEQAIVDFVGQQRDLMLAMATRGNTALRTALLGSVTAACLRRSGMPILAACPGNLPG